MNPDREVPVVIDNREIEPVTIDMTVVVAVVMDTAPIPRIVVVVNVPADAVKFEPSAASAAIDEHERDELQTNKTVNEPEAG